MLQVTGGGIDPKDIFDENIDDDDSEKNHETANRIGIKGRRIMPNQVEDVKKMLLEFNVKILI